MSEQAARNLLNIDFRAIEATVLQALGRPVPAW